MKLLFSFFLMLLPTVAFALTPFAYLGADYRFERSEDQAVRPKLLPNFGAGMIDHYWFANIEYASFSESNGNSTLNLKRSFESAFVWGYWQATDLDWISPFAGAGFGMIRQKVDINLYGESSNEEGAWDPTLGGALGLRLVPKSWFWVSTEARLYKNPYLDPDPQMGVLFRLGIIFK